MAEPSSPLSGILVLDGVRGQLAAATRYLADLGATVERLISLDPDDPADIAANAGKCWPRDASDPVASISNAHAIVVDRTSKIDLSDLRRRRPEIVTMMVSDFGGGNPLSDWKASDAVLHALSGELARSGLRGKPPLLPPGDLAYQCAATQAAFLLCSAIYRSLRSGQGAHFDFSALEGAVQALDPGFGISGSATMGKPAGLLSRDRPRPGFQYPIFPCADGYVRVCILAKRQWRGMFEWMGEPEQFAAPEFDKLTHRYKSPDLLPYIGSFLAGKSRADIEREGQDRGVPTAGMATLEEFMASEHVAARRALRTVEIGARSYTLPDSVFVVDGARANQGSREPGYMRAAEADACTGAALPFAGLKVLDLGVIVVGAEQGRLLADFGADVVKVESRAFPDGNRQSYTDFGMSVSFAAGQRNKRSLGLDLRSEAGQSLFLDLVAEADVVCSNFKPGTLEKLGLGRDRLVAANPKIILSESSAFGDEGPWSGRMGYGPLVRAATGLALAWRYPGEPDSFSDSITIYPDHTAARICATGVVALLIRRLRTGGGGVTSISQAEVMLTHFAQQVLEQGSDFPSAPAAQASRVVAAQGDDEWCVVTIAETSGREGLEQLLGPVAGDLENRLASWIAERDPREAADRLQEAGIAAAPMLRLADLPMAEPFVTRAFFRKEGHPWLNEIVTAERSSAFTSDFPSVPLRPAPLVGEQSEEVIADWLGLPSDEIAELIASGVLEPLDDTTRRSAEAYVSVPQGAAVS